MVRFLGSGRSCAVLAIIMILTAGCGTGRAHAAPAGQPRSPRPRPVPSATGIVKHAGFLTGVSCLPAGTCVAVGWYYSSSTGPSLAMAMRWNGRAWLAMPAPSRGHRSQLDGVSCPSPTVCVALGRRQVDGPAHARHRPRRILGADRRVLCHGGELHGGGHLQRRHLRHRGALGRRPVDGPAPARAAGAAG